MSIFKKVSWSIFLGVLLSFIIASCNHQEQSSGTCPIGFVENQHGECFEDNDELSSNQQDTGESNAATLNEVSQTDELNGRFSYGEKTLLTGQFNALLSEGNSYFSSQDYLKASERFESAVEGDVSNPEALIYLNNSLARQQGNTITLAVVVPIDKHLNDSKEMLRGIAMAQDSFNQSRGQTQTLLEILIVNDGNKPEVAKKVAVEIINNESIVGVIGHNQSKATEAALPVYEQANLPVISPTSTSTELRNSSIFFRTVLSDEAAALKLADHTFKKLKIDRVLIFNNPDDTYSRSLTTAFEQNYRRLGGEFKTINLAGENFNARAELENSVETFQAGAIVLFPDKDNVNVAIEIANKNYDLFNENAPQLLGGDALYGQSLIQAGGKNLEGLILAIDWFSEAEEAQRFKLFGEQQWGGGIVNWRTARSFDATKVYLEVFKDSSNFSKDYILTELKSINLSASETSGEPLKFDSQKERSSSGILVRVTRDPKNKVSNSEFGYELISNN